MNEQEKINEQTDRELLSYLAGRFESEGNLSLTTRGNHFVFQFTIEQKDNKPLELFVQRFGGKIYNTVFKTKLGKVNSYRYVVTGKNIPPILDIMLPFFKFKYDEYKTMVDKYKESFSVNSIS